MPNITKEEAQALFESGNESFKEIALRYYPELEHREKTMKDYGILERGYWVEKFGKIQIANSLRLNETDTNIFPTSELAELCGQIIPQLTLWRDKYNGCELKELKGQEVWCIDLDLYIYRFTNNTGMFPFRPVFKTKEIAKQFIKDHKTLIKRYYELLYV